MTQHDEQGTVVGSKGKARKSRAKVAQGTEQGGTGATRKATAPRRMGTADRLAVGVAVGGGLSTVVCSMVLNVRAFTLEQSTAFGAFLGIAVPLWVLVATYLGQHMHGKCAWCCRGAYALAGFLLVVSLPHLAAGYAALGLAPYEGWALAVVTDLLQVCCKVAVVRMVRGK